MERMISPACSRNFYLLRTGHSMFSNEVARSLIIKFKNRLSSKTDFHRTSCHFKLFYEINRNEDKVEKR